MECLDFWDNNLYNSKDHRKYVSSAVRVHSLYSVTPAVNVWVHLMVKREGGKIAHSDKVYK